MRLISYSTDFALDKSYTMNLIALEEQFFRVVGSCQLREWETDTPFFTSLHVHSNDRRSGVGRKLLSLAIDHCKSSRKNAITLTCHKSNEAALALYRSVGFTHYEQDDQEFCMVLILNNAAAK